MTEVLYRYQDRRVSTWDSWNDRPGNSYSVVDCREYPIIKRTPKGAWINEGGGKRFVNLTTRKKFACETKEDAKLSFIKRKERQIKILTSNLENAKAALSYAQGMSVDDQANRIHVDEFRLTNLV